MVQGIKHRKLQACGRHKSKRLAPFKGVASSRHKSKRLAPFGRLAILNNILLPGKMNFKHHFLVNPYSYYIFDSTISKTKHHKKNDTGKKTNPAFSHNLPVF